MEGPWYHARCWINPGDRGSPCSMGMLHHIFVAKALGGLGQWDGLDRGLGAREERWCQYLGERRHSIEEGRGDWGEGSTLEDYFGSKFYRI